MQYTEIEHKYLVDASFDYATFAKKVRTLSPTRETVVQVVDTYLLLENHDKHVYRHRKDDEIQQLTVKSFGSGNEHRLEVNLDLDQSSGNQLDAARAFMSSLGSIWEGKITKDVRVFYFNDCELVYYIATSSHGSVHCIEAEAHNAVDLASGLATLTRYEQALGLDVSKRSKLSLLELLFPEQHRPAWHRKKK